MSDSKRKEKDDLNSLSNRDTVDLPDDLSLSDSDSDEPIEHFGRKIEDLSSSSEDEDETPQHVQSVPQENPTFKLTGGSSGFCNRSRDIFAQLDSAAKITSKDLGEDNILDGTFARPAPPSPPQPAQSKCGQETTEKQPPSKKLPDYLAHPERWTHYSLEDIPETSDRKNSQVAHQYIQGLQESKKSQKDTIEIFTPAFNQDPSSKSENKIVFTKPKIKDQSGSKLDHAKKEVGLQHLDHRQETDEGGDAHLQHHRISWKNKEKKRKWGAEKVEEDIKVSSVVFNSSKKINRKHFRKTLEDDEGGTE
ncbi:U5 small nuclear ribonucleoprotein TSSC4 [Garra rufa]|uniref:U5 small nuclear ribonucleoprotein TSSC4 n=1 Tax=Garra rufa TaxID=137080 RepID=UPI003CCE8F7B